MVSGAAWPGASSGCSGPTVCPSVLVEDVKLSLLDDNRHTHPVDEFIYLLTTSCWKRTCLLSNQVCLCLLRYLGCTFPLQNYSSLFSYSSKHITYIL